LFITKGTGGGMGEFATGGGMGEFAIVVGSVLQQMGKLLVVFKHCPCT
jgi:hypothetical protein